ncbi:DUF4865 family protein [Streptosporangium carneum]|nr:DUF4865 family protein [Streptosporangium carneum]
MQYEITLPADYDMGIIRRRVETRGRALDALAERETGELRRFAETRGAHSAALLLDPRGWEMLRLTLWEHAVPATEPAGDRYEILHLSAPGLDDIPAGRLW